MRNYESYFQQNRRDVRKQRSVIFKTLSGNPATISELHKSTKMPKDLLLWNLVGMIRWGDVDVVGEDEHELIYALKEV